METYELEEEVYRKLSRDTELAEIIANGSIYHKRTPAVKPARYPIIVYAPISDVPLLSSDNKEYAHRVTMRIHVIGRANGSATDNEKFIKCCERIKQLMTGLKFNRIQTTDYENEGKKMKIMDFVIGVRS